MGMSDEIIESPEQRPNCKLQYTIMAVDLKDFTRLDSRGQNPRPEIYYSLYRHNLSEHFLFYLCFLALLLRLGTLKALLLRLGTFGCPRISNFYSN